MKHGLTWEDFHTGIYRTNKIHQCIYHILSSISKCQVRHLIFYVKNKKNICGTPLSDIKKTENYRSKENS